MPTKEIAELYEILNENKRLIDEMSAKFYAASTTLSLLICDHPDKETVVKLLRKRVNDMPDLLRALGSSEQSIQHALKVIEQYLQTLPDFRE